MDVEGRSHLKRKTEFAVFSKQKLLTFTNTSHYSTDKLTLQPVASQGFPRRGKLSPEYEAKTYYLARFFLKAE